VKSCCALAALAIALTAGGCGEDRDVTTAATATTAAAGEEILRFRTLANDVCGTVLHGAPPPLPPDAGLAALARQARASVPYSRSASVSLSRLDPPAELRPAVKRLTDDYRDLQRLYARLVRTKADDPRLLEEVREREISVRAQATDSGLPACGGGPVR
jgi:hypothetical protein